MFKFIKTSLPESYLELLLQLDYNILSLVQYSFLHGNLITYVYSIMMIASFEPEEAHVR